MSRKILVIDDEDDIREVAQVCLEMVGGWEVVAARSGLEGINKARTDQPDAILLDVMMPEMDGPTTWQKLQDDEQTKHIPVILLTAKVQAADQRRFASLGVNGVITKPFDPMNLSNEVSTTLGWS
ncbi:MAG TPA: response regulator [Candidatus Xenobia bacterium]|jgi:CheY-like chemotaxis protein